MRLALLCLALLGASTLIQAQEFTQSLSGVEWVRIESKQQLNIRAGGSGQLQIRGKSPETPDKARGLKLVGAGGTDNTGVGFYMIKEGSTLILRNLSRQDDHLEILLPASQNLAVVSNGLEDIELGGFTGEIEVTSEVTGNIRLENVTGPVTAQSNTGNVDIRFTNVSQQSPISVTTATGDVDISLPASTPANLELQSSMGNIYTNFDIAAPDKDGLKAVSAQKIEGSINQGGVAISLTSATGNIYLRKK